MFLNVFYSWLIAQVFHPILFIASLWLLDGRFFINVEYIFFFLLISILVSLPGLLAGWLCMGLIAYSNYTITAKFFMWLATTALLVILTLWIVILFFDGGLQLEFLLAAIPGILSIWIASVIRLKQFHKLIYSVNRIPEDDMLLEPKNEEYHDN